MDDILKTQQSFARKASAQPEHRFGDLYHLICRDEWLWTALRHVLSNIGARTAGVDGISKADLKTPAEQAQFISQLRDDLKSGQYNPMPVKRKWIDKPGKNEKRGLGIPTIRDRVVQELLRMLMEPIWESDFLDGSHGFRQHRRTMDCISVFYSRVTTNNKFYWAIEGDIRKCFDRINHRILMRLIRQRIDDYRIARLIEGFLKAGILEDGLFQDTDEGTPQGGILSPLLANIYLHQFDLWWQEKFGKLTRYEQMKRRRAGLGNAVLVRYADDWVILWNGTHEDAKELRDEVKQLLWEELHLELSEEKTHITHLTNGLDFLGFHIQLKLPCDGHKPWLRITPTEANLKRFRAKIKAQTRPDTTFVTPEMKFKSLSRLIRGWGNYYRHVSFTHDAGKLDYFINQRVLIWLMKKHERRPTRWVIQHYKRRETTQRHNRWNFGTADSRDGTMVYIAKLSDIPKVQYRRRKPPHPYLTAEIVPCSLEPETPFVETDLVNLPPEALIWCETRAQVFKRDNYQCTNCGRPTPLQAHHEVSQQEGGKHVVTNLSTLCWDCHKKTPSYGRSPERKRVRGKAG